MRRIARARKGGGILGAAVLIGVLASSASGGTPADPEPGFLGVLLPGVETRLAPLAEGRLLRLHVRIGDRVQENALLAEIDEDPIRREQAEAAGRLEEARGAEAEAVTRLTMARETLTRLQALDKERIVSAEQLGEGGRQVELSQATLQRAQARVQQELASMKQLEAKLANTRVQAPFAGRVAETYADPGTSVGPDTPIVRLISDGTHWARFAVPVSEARGLSVGGRVRVSVPDAGIELIGSIKQVGPAVDPASGMVIYEAVVQTPPAWGGPPLAGQAVRVWPADARP